MNSVVLAIKQSMHTCYK